MSMVVIDSKGVDIQIDNEFSNSDKPCKEREAREVGKDRKEREGSPFHARIAQCSAVVQSLDQRFYNPVAPGSRHSCGAARPVPILWGCLSP